MPKATLAGILAIAAVIVSLPAVAQEKFSMTISIGPPLYFEESDGFFELLTAEIFERLDLEHEIIWLPPQRSLLYTSDGTYDGHIARTAAVELKFPELIRVPVNVFDFEFMAFARDPDIQINGWESLLPYSVGMINGWKIAEQNTAGAKSVARANDYGQLLSMLEKERIDIAILDRVMGGWKLKQLGYDIKVLEPPIVSKPNFIYLNKKHAGLAPKIAAVLEAMKKDGSFDAIYAQTVQPGNPQ